MPFVFTSRGIGIGIGICIGIGIGEHEDCSGNCKKILVLEI